MIGQFPITQLASPPQGEVNPLTVGLSAYWKLREASGTRYDSIGTVHLTSINAVAQGAAIAANLGNSALFDHTASQYLSAASSSAIQTGDIDYSLMGWIHPTDAADNRYIIARDGAEREYALIYNGPALSAWFLVFGAGSVIVGNLQTAGVINPSTSHFVVAQHSAATNEIGISLNGGAFVTAATTGPAAATNVGIGIGARSDGFGPFSGRLSDWLFYKRLLAGDEIAYYYNGGAGVLEPF